MKQLEDMTEPEIRLVMNAIANGVVGAATEAGIGKPLFVLLLCNDPKVGQYVSNCQRPDMIKALRECADRLEKLEDVSR